MRNLISSFILGAIITGSLASLAQAKSCPLTDQSFRYEPNSRDKLIENARSTRLGRVKEAFEDKTAEGMNMGLCQFISKLYLGQDIESVNNEMCSVLTSTDKKTRARYGLDDHWSLVMNQQLYWIYYAFGSNGRIAKGRINAGTQKAVLDLLWERMKLKNDIHLARQSTWWMTGSENHDLVGKVSNLISSRIFMNEPEYASRIYPDIGRGGGSGYWFHQMYGGTDDFGPEGRGNFKDGKEYNARDHYDAWVKFFKEYIRERVRKGFFLEVASPGYMRITLTHLADIYELSGDKELAALSEKFLDLVWTDWALEQFNGVRGGAKTRVADNKRWKDSMYRYAEFYFGGEGNAGANCYSQLLGTYELKPIVWEIALDREKLGEFAYITRKPGEEENRWPRPFGAERTLLCDTEARFVHYSWITPDYILGCQMDHPGAIHSHLSVTARWLGIIFRGDNGPRIYPCDINDTGDSWTETKSGYCRCVQDKRVLVAQQCRRWMQINPDWFPVGPPGELIYGIYIGKDHDKVVEQNGWIFVQHGNAYLAIRVLLGEYSNAWKILKDPATSGRTSSLVTDSYVWNKQRTMIKLRDKYSGMLFEAARKEQYKQFEDFIADVLDNKLELVKTVVPGWHILKYKGCAPDAAQIYFNLANTEMPMLNEQYIDYSPKMVFDSPYLKSVYNSGIISIQKGDESSILDFNTEN